MLQGVPHLSRIRSAGEGHQLVEQGPHDAGGRLAPGATYREDLSQLLVPVPAGQAAADVVGALLDELVPLAGRPDSGPAGDTL